MDDLGTIFRSTYRGNLAELAHLALPWEKVVGQALAKHCRPRRLKYGILFVSTTNSAWANQLVYYREEIKDKVNEFLGKAAVKDVRFEGIGLQAESLRTDVAAGEKSRRHGPEYHIVKNEVDKISNEQLREDLLKVISKHLSTDSTVEH